MTNSQPPIPEQYVPFLQKVMTLAKLPDIYDARDITVVVFRTMRDLMTTDAANKVASELEAKESQKEEKEEADDLALLWKDTNPLVAFLSKVRPPLQFDGETFIFRVNQEAGVPKGINATNVIKAVFAATKPELSPARVQEIAGFLPDKVKVLWNEA
jgi:uncharacterized protein (DUF2267 family)